MSTRDTEWSRTLERSSGGAEVRGGLPGPREGCWSEASISAAQFGDLGRLANQPSR